MRFSHPKHGAGVVALAAALAVGVGVAQERSPGHKTFKALPNYFPQINANGFSATFSTPGFVDLTTDYFQAQGSNGRSCATCHIPQNAWSITPEMIRLRFAQTGGMHPIFNPLDADNPNRDLSFVEARREAYSTLLKGGCP